MEYVTKDQFAEYGKAVDAKLDEVRAENKRQNHRLDKAEEWQDKFSEMQATLKAQGDSIQEIGEKLNKIAAKPGEKWEKFMSYLGTVLVSLIIGYLFSLFIGG